MKPHAIVVVTLLLATSLPAQAQYEDLRPGPWHFRDFNCVDTTVRSVTARLGGTTRADFKQSGVAVFFNGKSGTIWENAGVVHYQGEPGNDTMEREHPGDKVQVCYLGPPFPTTDCDPNEDGRGRQFRVWDYKQHAQYAGMNSEHGCGGA